MSRSGSRIPEQHRYGIVLLLTIAAVIDVILASDTPLSRGIALLVLGAALLAVIATTRRRPLLQSGLGTLTAIALTALALTVVFSLTPRWVASAAGALVVGIVLFVLVRSVGELVRSEGVTIHAVAGALAIYLLVGLAFALLISVIAHLGPPYFMQGRREALSEQTYFSFTTMTTTGYGDLTPATNVGHAIAVLEMLLGQIYLVTVIGLLVGNLTRRPRAGEAP